MQTHLSRAPRELLANNGVKQNSYAPTLLEVSSN